MLRPHLRSHRVLYLYLLCGPLGPEKFLVLDTGPACYIRTLVRSTQVMPDYVIGHWASGDGRVDSNSLLYGSSYLGSAVREPDLLPGLLVPRDAKARRRTTMKYDIQLFDDCEFSNFRIRIVASAFEH